MLSSPALQTGTLSGQGANAKKVELMSHLTRSADLTTGRGGCRMLPPGKDGAFFPGDVHAHKGFVDCFSGMWSSNVRQELGPRTCEFPSASEPGIPGSVSALLKNPEWLHKAS